MQLICNFFQTLPGFQGDVPSNRRKSLTFCLSSAHISMLALKFCHFNFWSCLEFGLVPLQSNKWVLSRNQQPCSNRQANCVFHLILASVFSVVLLPKKLGKHATVYFFPSVNSKKIAKILKNPKNFQYQKKRKKALILAQGGKGILSNLKVSDLLHSTSNY